MMEITINKGTTDVIIDIEDLIVLLEYKLIALRSYKDKGLDVNERLIDTLDGHSYLQEYLLSIYKDDE
jgi:hypothetical protein